MIQWLTGRRDKASVSFVSEHSINRYSSPPVINVLLVLFWGNLMWYQNKYEYCIHTETNINTNMNKEFMIMLYGVSCCHLGNLLCCQFVALS